MALADPRCAACGGTGHIVDDPESIVPVFGRTCDCVRRAMAAADLVTRLEASGLPDRYADARFDRFGLRNTTPVEVMDPDRREKVVVQQREVDRRNLERVVALAAAPLTDETVAFTGPPGVGKTYLAACLLLAQIRDHARRGLYLTPVEYIRRLLPDGDEPDAQRALRITARTIDVLLLDDLGVEKGSPFVMRELWEVIHHRTSNGLPTIVTSNLSIGDALAATRDTKGLGADAREASDLGKRIYSRLAETRLPPIAWPAGSSDVRFTQEGAATRAGSLREARRELRRDLAGSGWSG